MNILLRIKQSYSLLNEKNQRIAELFLHEPEALQMTLAELGKKSQTSAATVIRFIRKYDFESFDRFRLELAKEIGNQSEIDFIIDKNDSIDVIKQRVEQLLQTTAQDTSSVLGEKEIETVIQALRLARRVYTIGIGSSSEVAYDLAHKLNRSGHLAVHNWDIHITIEELHYISKNDVLLAFSYSGRTKEVRLACKVAKERGAKVFLVTSSLEEELRKITDEILLQPKTEHLLRISTFSSFASAMQIVTILFLGMLESESEESIIQRIKKTSELIREIED